MHGRPSPTGTQGTGPVLPQGRYARFQCLLPCPQESTALILLQGIHRLAEGDARRAPTFAVEERTPDGRGLGMDTPQYTHQAKASPGAPFSPGHMNYIQRVPLKHSKKPR